jgi:ureidoacrylate peracid hydrolase
MREMIMDGKFIAPARTALIVVDVQNDYCDPKGSLGCAGADLATVGPAVANIERLIGAARAVGTAVIFVRNWHEHWTDSETWLARKTSTSRAAISQSWGAEFFKVVPLAGEPIINKYRYSGFVGTTLDQALRTLKRDTLIMTGIATNVCVESTARHAVFLDYRIVFMSDATATADGDTIQKATLHNMERHFGRVAATDDVIGAWNAAAVPRESVSLRA